MHYRLTGQPTDDHSPPFGQEGTIVDEFQLAELTRVHFLRQAEGIERRARVFIKNTAIFAGMALVCIGISACLWDDVGGTQYGRMGRAVLLGAEIAAFVLLAILFGIAWAAAHRARKFRTRISACEGVAAHEPLIQSMIRDMVKNGIIEEASSIPSSQGSP